MNRYNKLIKQLITSNILHSTRIIKSFKEIKRKDFLPESVKEYAYLNEALPIGYGQTNSQPATVAFMLELLEIDKSHIVMEVGSGSGWVCGLLSNIVGNKGKVYGLERIQELVDMGRSNLSKYENIEIRQAIGGLGIPKMVFDRILVSAESKEIPEELINQLKEDAIMVIPILRSVFKIRKIGREEIEVEEYKGFKFVELVR